MHMYLSRWHFVNSYTLVICGWHLGVVRLYHAVPNLDHCFAAAQEIPSWFTECLVRGIGLGLGQLADNPCQNTSIRTRPARSSKDISSWQYSPVLFPATLFVRHLLTNLRSTTAAAVVRHIEISLLLIRPGSEVLSIRSVLIKMPAIRSSERVDCAATTLADWAPCSRAFSLASLSFRIDCC